MIPGKIETTGIMTNDFDFTLGGGGACGGVSFKLSDRTINEIKTQGIAYFVDAALQGSATYQGKIDHWRAWRKAPVIAEDEEYAAPHRGCTENFKKFLDKNGYKISADVTGYYTYIIGRGYSNLWVFPEWGVIVYNFNY